MQRLRRVIQSGIESGLHPGAQACVIHQGRLVLNEGFGAARPGVAMTADSLVLWMSSGKPVTAVAVLQLIEQQRLTLETRVAEIIPAFAAGGKESITVRHCLLHTGGFRGPLSNFTPGPWESIIDRVCALRREPNWTPGEKAGYHVGSSWFALGEIVRVLDGEPFDRAVRRRVFGPIDAVDAYIGLPAETAARYGDRLARTQQTDATPPAAHAAGDVDGYAVARPGANLIAPARQLAEMYVSLLARDGRLLSGQAIDAMTTRQRRGMFDETFKRTLDWGYGLKLDSKRYDTPGAPGETYGYGVHASDATFGHAGHQCSCAFADPVHGLVVAWSCTGMPGEAAHHARQLAIHAAIYEDLGLV
ncbi:MAG TPA: serine hydrolase domain-containing protein [Tepidisphaeraceae bacterium]|jgi:CubicO group peptidase (beta-lactamase class C family)